MLFLVSTLPFKPAYSQKLASESPSYSSYVIDKSGNLYVWGANGQGQLGIGNTTDQSTPQTVIMPTGVTSWVAVTGGYDHSLAIGNDGNLYAWGKNSDGELGIGGTATPYTTPQKVNLPSGVTSWIAVAAGGGHSLAIGNDGSLYAWGLNGNGQLGIGNTTDQDIPQKVPFPSGVTSWIAVAAGWDQSLAIGNDGNVYTWGDNSYGELGLGNIATPFTTPQRVVFPNGVKAVGAGQNFSLALGNHGNLYAWGYNGDGELGLGNTTTPITTPQRITFPAEVTGWDAVAAGGDHSLAIGNDGNIYVWGSDQDGQLGIGFTAFAPQDTLQKVSLPSGVTTWKAVAAGRDHSLAIGDDGHAYSWGLNYNGQLGTDNTTDYDSPIHVLGVGGTGDLSHVEKRFSPVPGKFSLGQNYPNPFNPTTVISYQLSAVSNVTLKVYDVLGREVATLVNERENAGNYSVAFDGSRLASGVYFYRLSARSFVSVKKLVLVK